MPEIDKALLDAVINNLPISPEMENKIDAFLESQGYKYCIKDERFISNVEHIARDMLGMKIEGEVCRISEIDVEKKRIFVRYLLLLNEIFKDEAAEK